jgi:hypothetical protein
VADLRALEPLWRQTLAANVRYYRAVGRLAADYTRAVVSTVAELRTTGRPDETAPPVPRALPPVMALEAQDAGTAVGVFVVENATRERVSGAVETSPLVDGEGRQAQVELSFEPAVVALDPGEQTLVQISAEIGKTLRPSVDYRGEVRVPGLAGTRIPIVVRRLPSTRSRRRPAAG